MVDAEKTYEFLLKVPLGKVTTYLELAKVMKTGPRVIGRIMKNNSNPIVVPCHRVVKSTGELGGYAFGLKKKKELLEKEGLKVSNGKILDFQQVLHRF